MTSLTPPRPSLTSSPDVDRFAAYCACGCVIRYEEHRSGRITLGRIDYCGGAIHKGPRTLWEEFREAREKARVSRIHNIWPEGRGL